MPSKDDDHNTAWTITIKNPLLRPGVELKAGPVSEDYVVPTVRKGIGKARRINVIESNSDDQ
jgi:hypothetical protein